MSISQDRAIAVFAASISIIFLYILTERSTLAILGVGVFIYFVIKFFFDLGTKIQVKDLMILIALLQWVVGPVLAYSYNPDDLRYYMAVSEETYMNYVFPATMVFIIGLYFPLSKKVINEDALINKIRDLLKKYPDIDIILIAIGIVGNLIVDSVPGSLRFVMVLVGSVRFIGIYFLLLNENRNYKWLIFGIVVGWLFYEAISKAMFHELLLWLGFLFIIIAFIRKFSNQKKLTYLLLLAVLAILIQTVKYEYRKLTWYGQSGAAKGNIFTELVIENIEDPSYIFSDVNIKATITRINQGWIIARIMNHTPAIEPFAKGETILEGLEATLLPRIIAPNKAKAGGHENFERFTGKELLKGTSMGLSPLGEAYANFGVEGGILFMFFFGLFFNFFLAQIYNFSYRYPTLILWIPLMFLYVVRAESDFVVVMNYLIKSSVIVWLFYWGFRKFLGIQL